MKKYFVLKRNEHFNKIITEGKKTTNRYFIVYFLPSVFLKLDNPHIGISVGKKLGNAPLRNYNRRKIRMIIQNNESAFTQYSYVIIIKQSAFDLKFTNLEENLIRLIKGIHDK